MFLGAERLKRESGGNPEPARGCKWHLTVLNHCLWVGRFRTLLATSQKTCLKTFSISFSRSEKIWADTVLPLN
jgi:hypothetical protein